MKGRHTVTAEDLDKWLREPRWLSFARSFSNVSHKTLEIDAASDGRVFRVTDHGETKFLGTDKAAAIDAYNDAQ